jgi:hypothetical protein
MFLKNFLNHKNFQIEKIQKFKNSNLAKFNSSNFHILNNIIINNKFTEINQNNKKGLNLNLQKRDFCQSQSKLHSTKSTNQVFSNSKIPEKQAEKTISQVTEPYFRSLFNKYLEENTFHEIEEGNFDVFLDKVKLLIQKEENRRLKNKNFASEIRQITICSKEPMRDVLIHYEIYRNQNGLDAEAVAEAMLVLGKLYSSRDRYFRVYADLSHWEFINSVRTFNLSEDIKACILNEFAYLTGDQLIRIIRGMKLAHYKNTELMELVLQRLENYVNLGKSYLDNDHLRFAHIPGSGKKNFGYINKFSTLFQEDEGFKSYISKLLKFDYDENDNTENDTISKIKFNI